MSPFDFARWHKLWRLSASFSDRPGLLNEVCECFHFYGVNILASESGMMEEQNVYHIEMIVDVEEEEIVPLIEWTLQARLFSGLLLSPDGAPRLSIRRLHNLWLAKTAFERQKRTQRQFSPVNDEVSVKIDPDPDLGSFEPHKKDRPKIFRLKLPRSFKTILNAHVPQTLDDHRVGSYYLRLSDTKDRFMRVLFFRVTDPVIHTRLEYKDRLGSAATVTRALKDNGFNILAAYLGPAEGERRSRCELIVSAPSIPCTFSSELKPLLEAALSRVPALHELEMVVGYPHDYGRKWDSHVLTCDASTSVPTDEPDISIASLKQQLDIQISDLHYRVTNGTNFGGYEERDRLNFGQQLQKRGLQLWGLPGKKSLFVSSHFHGSQLDVVKNHAALRFDVATGKGLGSHQNITTGLLHRIRSCTHFLGVWSRDGAQKHGQKYFPSPWLLWEFGVAQAYGLTCRLLISNEISETVWHRVNPNVQNIMFDTADFESKLEEALEILSGIEHGDPGLQMAAAQYDSLA